MPVEPLVDMFLIIGLIWGVCCLFVVPVYLLKLKFLFDSLEKNYEETWKSLGSPSLIMNNSLGNNIKFIKWLLKKQYTGLNEQTINLSNQCRYLFLLGMTGTIVSIIILPLIFN